LQHHHEREEGGCLPDCDHVLVQFCTPRIGKGHNSIAAVTVTHFDQCDEQSSTDNGKKDGQNPSLQGSDARREFVNKVDLLNILDAARFR
jgi:hypothetical protein